ncbi:phospholipase A2-like [Chelonus insularis]|uniref:phospholipase A2-like n=1 Tax=Chelonus insularis TaxID=460826 RepID=UPI00158E8C79|nr:phospholipase A2-like [Chelonus insularis]
MDYFNLQIKFISLTIFIWSIYSIYLSQSLVIPENNTSLLNISYFNDDNLMELNDTHAQKRRELIFPGTLWCGLGNVAVYDDEVGFFSYTDSCCKNHDKCRLDVSYSHKSKIEGVIDFLFKSDTICPCDSAFYVCLRKANTFISKTVGKIFFNVLRPTCLTLDHPILSCTKYQGKLFRHRCLEYELNTSAPMTIYRKDNPFFY